ELCKPLNSSSVDLECSFNSVSVPCNKALRPGTLVQAQCKHSYNLLSLSDGFDVTRCLANGELETPLFHCTPECGIVNHDSARPLINDGEVAKVGEYPWHVGIYRSGKNDQICGGTLLSPHIVLTAAHCVYSESKHKVLDPSNFLVAVGKYKRALDPPEPFQQVEQAREVILELGYRGSRTGYEQDIAIIDVKKHFILSNMVLPVCLDGGSLRAIPVGTKGTVVGWGKTEKKVSSEVLLVTHLPLIDYQTCNRDLPDNFIRFITSDKFCAGYINGTGVQEGDSGGGLTFQEFNKHYIHGVVSLKPKEVEKSYALFTNVTIHKSWILKTIRALKPHHPN
ncbi:hypothetical protein AAG570_003129, partial [Ranatra chinensis]